MKTKNVIQMTICHCEYRVSRSKHTHNFYDWMIFEALSNLNEKIYEAENDIQIEINTHSWALSMQLTLELILIFDWAEFLIKFCTFFQFFSNFLDDFESLNFEFTYRWFLTTHTSWPMNDITMIDVWIQYTFTGWITGAISAKICKLIKNDYYFSVNEQNFEL